MKVATFWLNHDESDSRAIAEFGLIQGKVSLVGLGYIRGNVINLNDYAWCKKRVEVLLNGETNQDAAG